MRVGDRVQSYPARGTWIEICAALFARGKGTVVPRTGYVDRNADDDGPLGLRGRRTPHGVRG